MPSTKEFSQESATFFQSHLRPIGAGFSLVARDEAIILEVDLMGMKVAGQVPDGGENGEITGVFWYQEDFSFIPEQTMSALCDALAESDFLFSPAPGRPLYCLKQVPDWESPLPNSPADTG